LALIRSAEIRMAGKQPYCKTRGAILAVDLGPNAIVTAGFPVFSIEQKPHRGIDDSPMPIHMHPVPGVRHMDSAAEVGKSAYERGVALVTNEQKDQLMANTSFPANDFTVRDSQTTISFATTSINGRATFNYRSGPTNVQLSGDDIRSVDEEFTKLVTATIGGEGDGGVSTVTLLMPKISLPSPTATVEFDTIAILTEQRRLGPSHQHYKALYLHGTAQQTVF
jgi:hypothetical protein